MRVAELAEGVSVGTQPMVADFAAIAARGVRTVINNRPDGEEDGQIPSDEAARVAAALGLRYHYQPVTTPGLTRACVARFDALLSSCGGPVLAHCRTGTRSAILWVIREALAGRMRREEILPFGQARGLDLSAAVAWLDRDAGSSPERLS